VEANLTRIVVWFFSEAEYAFQLKKKIIPLKMEGNYKATKVSLNTHSPYPHLKKNILIYLFPSYNRFVWNSYQLSFYFM
jgi:hypothetical protein